MGNKNMTRKHYLLASDFDQTLSFNDSGLILSQLIGASDFTGKVSGLSRMHFIQQGGELTYLLLHDPEYRCVRREHMVEVGKQIRLKANIRLLSQLLDNLDGHRFSFSVISAAPEELVQSALEGSVAPDHIPGTRFHYDPSSGEIESIIRVPAGYGKVAVLEELKSALQVSDDRVVYVGDGSSDIHVMLHVNRCDGLTVAVSEAKYVTRIARRTVLGEDALCVLVPILEEVAGWDPPRIRALFGSHGFVLQEWEKVRTDWLTIRGAEAAGPQAAA